MFGLPVATALLVFGFPVFWILYTIVFLVVTRDWGSENVDGDDRS
jgi:type III secretory pathway component EscV